MQHRIHAGHCVEIASLLDTMGGGCTSCCARRFATSHNSRLCDMPDRKLRFRPATSHSRRPLCIISLLAMMNKKKIYKNIVLILALLTLSFVFTILSSKLYVITYREIVGTECPGCRWENLPMGGFPFIYIKDNPATSVIGQLGFLGDQLFFVKFFLDWGFYAIVCTGIYLLLNQLRGKLKSPNNE